MPSQVAIDLREFIWAVGNGTTEAALCDTLRQHYKTLCELAELVDADLCSVDLWEAYKRRCYWGSNSSAATGGDTFLSGALILILCLTGVSVLRAKGIISVPESAITILCGAFTGLVFVASGMRPDQAHFSSDIFFDVLLPFIIFESGYNMEKKLFEKNFFEIVLLAIFGTFVSFAVVLGVMYGGTVVFGGGLSLLDCAMFASLISSTDPVAIVSVFSSLGVDPTLYALVFGESMLNDGVSVALYASMKYFYLHPEKTLRDDFLVVLGNFAVVFFGSLLLGFIFALVVAWFWKVRGQQVFTHPVLETLVYLLFAVLPYYAADALEWSGIIAIVSNSIALSIYAHDNLSKTSKFHVVFLVECFARLFEAIMFGYLGLQMVINNERMVYNWYLVLAVLAVFLGRACAVFPLLGLRNTLDRFWRTGSFGNSGVDDNQAIPVKHQFVIWFSGFRGALAFALAVTIPQYDVVVMNGSKHYGEILAVTCFIIVLNVFCMGSLAPWVLRRMDVVVGSSGEQHKAAGVAGGSRGGMDMLRTLHRQVLKPFFTKQDLLVSVGGGAEDEESSSTMAVSGGGGGISFSSPSLSSSSSHLALPPRLAVDDGFVVIDHHNDLVDVKPRMAFSQRSEVVLQQQQQQQPPSSFALSTFSAAPAVVVTASSTPSLRRQASTNTAYSLLRDDHH